MFYDILERKNAFLGYKTKKVQKVEKLRFFKKGLTHGFDRKIAIFPTFIFRQHRPEKCDLRYSRTKKRLSRLKKTTRSKSRKIEIFAKELTYGFSPKMAIFPTFSFFAIYARKMCFTIF